MMENKGCLQIGGDYTDTNLCGEIKNATGRVDVKFIKALEKLMEKYRVNYVQLYWSKWK